MEKGEQSNSPSRLADRYLPESFQEAYRQLPEYDIAESLVRLRRHRDLTQKELAKAMKTWQPVIAKMEAGAANLRISTLKRAAEALKAHIRITMEPAEFSFPDRPPWWDCLDMGLASVRGIASMTFVSTTQVGVAGEFSAAAYVEIDAADQATLADGPLFNVPIQAGAGEMDRPERGENRYEYTVANSPT